MMNLAKLATQMDGLKLLLVVHSREQLKEKWFALAGPVVHIRARRPTGILRQIQMKIFNSYVYVNV